MRFTVRSGSDPMARADSAILAAMGLPGGGILRVGDTHVVARPGEVPSPNVLLLDPVAMENAGVVDGSDVRADRVVLSQAQRVVVEATDAPLETRHLARSIQGMPVTVGDRVRIRPNYGEGTPDAVLLTVIEVEPGGKGLVGSATIVVEHGEKADPVVAQPPGHLRGEAPTTAEALLTGLDTELETMTGWLSLLTSTADLPRAWGLPSVAGVLLEGPSGCGKSELVAAAAAEAGAAVHEVSLELVFKPEKLLDVLEKAVHQTPVPAVVFVDRLDAVAGDEGMFRTQVAAIVRWFLDAVAGRPRLACVLGVSSVDKLGDSVAGSALLPRTLSIPPPDLERRRLLFEASLGRVPVAGDVDFTVLASRTAGFSGADILAAVVHASALIAPSGGEVTADLLARAIRETTPSLGTASLGEIPSYGFERVANLEEVKQRLTETVVWQLTDPGRFQRLGVEPPRGMLLHGPPGTGKTFVIRALAHEAGAAFFTVKGAELLDKYVGESERGVREIFARARAVAPAIIFFDEIDALAPVRGNSTNSVTDSVVAALLTEMDGVADRGDVFVIGATNRKDLIDPALLRSGRLETHIELGLPPAESRRAFFAISDVPLGGDVDLEGVISATEGLSFADLSGLLREAALQALRRDGTALAVTAADLDAALARFRSVPQPAD
jgi:transitional endoplasmic reticulum ATPase